MQQSSSDARSAIASAGVTADEAAMDFGAWQQLSPERAAKELCERVQQRLAPGQPTAVLSALLSEEAQRAAFEASRKGQPLSGVPYFTKDLFDTAEWPTRAGSTFLPSIRPSQQDGNFTRCMAASGAVLTGKTNLHEFAYGLTGENPHFGNCLHPRFLNRTTGGSSSGSAAAVAAGIVPFATGTDTGGSIRVPAAYCGIFGYRGKPRHPWITDAFPLSPSFDTAGWFTATARDMRDAARVLLPSGLNGTEPRIRFLNTSVCDPDVAAACRTFSQILGPPLETSVAAALAEQFSDASEIYSIISADEAWQVHRNWADRFREQYDPVVWQRLDRGRALTEEQRSPAAAGRIRVNASWQSLFEGADILLMPATPFAAVTAAENTVESRQRILRLTAPASIGGWPVLTIPIPLGHGLTSGLQVILREERADWVLAVLDRWADEVPDVPAED